MTLDMVARSQMTKCRVCNSHSRGPA